MQMNAHHAGACAAASSKGSKGSKEAAPEVATHRVAAPEVVAALEAWWSGRQVPVCAAGRQAKGSGAGRVSGASSRRECQGAGGDAGYRMSAVSEKVGWWHSVEIYRAKILGRS